MLVSFAIVGACMGTLWLVSLRLRDASIVDPFWGPGFAIVAIVTFATHAAAGPRPAIVLAFVTIWASRLGIYLLRRRRGHGEDFRYAAMRRHHGSRFPLVSLFTVFGFQGLLMGILSVPLQLAITTPAPLGPLDALGGALWLVGFGFEAVGDAQLARFKADPANAGRVNDRGLWRYTRHPNYFGEATLWWGYGAFAAAAGAWWSLYSPGVVTFLLLKVSGVALLEKDIGERRPAYADYIRRTSAFFPWFPKG